MDEELKAHIEAWEGEAVVSRYDEATDAWIFIAIHSSRLGIPTGGTRLRVYPTPLEGLDDACRLAEGMTAKWAMLEMPIGGAKAVISLQRPVDEGGRTELLRRYGRLVESLGGRFATGEDLGTTPEDMAIISEETEHVHGSLEDGSVADPGPYTARGVFYAIREAVDHAWGGSAPDPIHVVVQGVGDVGAPLCELLVEAGARVTVGDVDPARVAALERRLDAPDDAFRRVEPEAVYGFESDVFAPCAISGVLNRTTIPRLDCRVVAGSANAQLADEEEDAARLAARDVLYVPDYAANGGGALAFALHSSGMTEPNLLMAQMTRIGSIVRELLLEAEERDETPHAVAARRVDRILAEGVRADRRKGSDRSPGGPTPSP